MGMSVPISKVSEKAQNTLYNAMYVKSVERDSKYTIRAHNLLAHNFLNIQPIFNSKKALIN